LGLALNLVTGENPNYAGFAQIRDVDIAHRAY